MWIYSMIVKDMIERYNEKNEGFDEEKLAVIANELNMTGLELLSNLCVMSLYANKAIEDLENEIRLLKIKNSSLEKITGKMQPKDLIRAGFRPAAKKYATPEKARELKKLGYSNEEIMKYLSISKSTLWRYLNKTKEQKQDKQAEQQDGAEMFYF